MRRLDRRGAIAFIDASEGQPDNCPVSQDELLARFHVREKGRVYSGAAGFAAMWRAIPILRPLGEMARLPGFKSLFEAMYKRFLRIRPRLQKWAGA